MPANAFLANCLWVLVIGLIGPSIPFIINEFGIDYSRAGLIFTLLSTGSLIGNFIGGYVSDFKSRKTFWIIFIACLAVGLVFCAIVPGYSLLLLAVFLMSLCGSPIGALGQGIMLQMYPKKRNAYLSFQTMFAAGGSIAAPLMISAAYLLGVDWRAAFFAIAGLAVFLLVMTSLTRLPVPESHPGISVSIVSIYKDRRVILVGMMIFFSVGIDLGFSYWLAEYFVSWVGAAPELSGFAVGSFLTGIIIGRLLNSKKPESVSSKSIILAGLTLSAAALLLFLNIDAAPAKLVFCLIYGIGVGPVFPLLMGKGTALYPKQSGAITGVLFSMMSLSGIVFPLVIGAVGHSFGIENAYYSVFFIMSPIIVYCLIGLLKQKKKSHLS